MEIGARSHIISATGFGEDQFDIIVQELKDLGKNPAEIYRLLMEGEGLPTTHISGKKEGEIKEGKRKRAPRARHGTASFRIR